MTDRLRGPNDARSRRLRLLLATFYVPPAAGGGIPRSTKFAKYLPELGWDVTVLTVSRRGSVDPLLPPPDEVVNTGELPVKPLLWAADALDRGVAALWRRLRPPSEPVLIDPAFAVREGEIPAARPGWVLPAIAAGARLARRRRFDLIVASMPPPMVGMVGWGISRLAGIPYVLDYRDPWAVDPVWTFDDVGRRRSDPAIKVRLALARAAERRLLRDAAGAVVVNGERHVDLLRQVYPGAARVPIWHVPNAVDLADVEAVRPAPEEDRDSRFVVTFNGHFYGSHTPYFVVRGLKRLAETTPQVLAAFRFDFVGTGFPLTLRAALPQWGLADAINVLEPEPYSASLARLHRADAMLLALAPFSSTVDTIPTKLWEYLAIGKPVLVVAPRGAASNILTGAGMPVVQADPADDVAVAQAVIDLLPLVQSRARRPGAADAHDYRLRAAQFDAVLRAALHSAADRSAV